MDILSHHSFNHCNDLNVLHVTIGTGWGGVSTHLNILLPKLQHNGIKTHFVSIGDSLLSQALASKGIPVRSIQRKSKTDLKIVAPLVKYIKNNSINILHMHGYASIIYGCLASLLLPKLKLVVTLHQPSETFSEIKDKSFRYSLILAYKFADFLGADFIAVSKHVLNSYINNYNFRESNTLVIYNGIDASSIKCNTAKPHLLKQLKIPSQNKIVSIVGRLEKVKGHKYFLQAAKKMLEKNKYIYFLIIGDGSEKSTILKLIENLNVRDNVFPLGFQENALDFLAITDVLVMSSLFEGIPYTLLEAMSLGANIVATNSGGITEVIENYSDGILINPRSPGEICSAVMEILTNDHLAHTLRTNAKKKVREFFNGDRMAELTYNAYRQIIGDSTQMFIDNNMKR